MRSNQVELIVRLVSLVLGLTVGGANGLSPSSSQSSLQFCSVVAAPALIDHQIETQSSVSQRLSNFLLAENATDIGVTFQPLELHSLTLDGNILDSWSEPIARWGTDHNDADMVDYAEVKRVTMTRFITYLAPRCSSGAAIPFDPVTATFVPVAVAQDAMHDPGAPVRNPNSTSSSSGSIIHGSHQSSVSTAAVAILSFFPLYATATAAVTILPFFFHPMAGAAN